MRNRRQRQQETRIRYPKRDNRGCVPYKKPPHYDTLQQEQEEDVSIKRRTKSRWNDEDDIYLPPPFPTFIPYGLPPKALKAFLIRARINEVSKQLHEIGHQEINPSNEMKRRNFDDLRRKTEYKNLQMEMVLLIEQAFMICPTFLPPSSLGIDIRKISHQRKLIIPVDLYPGYNFIGQIIGPRGETQKRLELETGCKISIRGKGSSKARFSSDGSRNSSSNHNEPLHVLIRARDINTLRKAVKIVEKLLIPRSEIKKQQLKKLAEIQGTLIEGRFDNNNNNNDNNPKKQRRKNQYPLLDDEPIEKKEEEKDEIYSQFVKELDGRVQNSFFSFFPKKNKKKKMKHIFPPGVDVETDNNYYLERIEDEEDDPDDYECLFMDFPVAPPGTIEEEMLNEILKMKKKKKNETRNDDKKKNKKNEQRRLMMHKEKKTFREILEEKKKREKMKKNEFLNVPPWEMDSGDEIGW